MMFGNKIQALKEYEYWWGKILDGKTEKNKYRYIKQEEDASETLPDGLWFWWKLLLGEDGE